MYCGYCGSQLKEALPFCPYCGKRISDQYAEPPAESGPESRPEPRADRRPEPRVESRPEPRANRRPEPRAESRPEPRANAADTRGTIPVPHFTHARQPQQRPNAAQKRSKQWLFAPFDTKRILIAATAIFLVLAIGIGVLFSLPGNSSSASNPFSKAIKSAPKNSDNREVLVVLSAAYETLFRSNSFKMDVLYDESEMLHLETQFGKDLVSSGIYGSYENEDIAFALSKGTLAVQYYGAGYVIDAAAIAPDLDKVADHLGKRIPEIDSADIQGLMNEVYQSEKTVISNVLHSVKRSRLNINALNALVSIAGNALNKQYDTDVPVTSLDSVFEIAGDFLAKMPDDLIRIEPSKSSANNRVYSYSFNAIDVADAFVRYVESDASLRDLVNLFFSAEMQESIKSEIARSKQDFYSDYALSGTVTLSGTVLKSIAAKSEYTTVQINLSGVNETKVSSGKADGVRETISGETTTVSSADDLIALIDEGLN